MISAKLRNIFIISVVLMYVHGLEEILTRFYLSDEITEQFSSLFTNIPQSVYYTFHLTWWILVLPLLLALVLGGRWVLRAMTIYGLVFLFELSHVIEAIVDRAYFPGLITSLIYVTVGFFYWKELIKNLKTEKLTEKSRRD